jgi:alkylation response protein AidB-like acyl-CoA dehydrogenase
MPYRVDLQDLEFQLFDWLRLEELLAHPRFAEWDRDGLRMVLGEAAGLAVRELASINAEGDRDGVAWQDGRVTLPPSAVRAWRLFREGGWVGLTSDPALGGMGLPDAVGSAANEIFAGANLSFNLVALLTRSAAQLVADYGTPQLREFYCRRMVDGTWTGTMCLTEPQAGSDVGASRTRAERQADGSYLISGEKIFITCGEHDLAENIVHAVLARTPGAPAGTRGLSLFLVPKIVPRADGSLGEPNDVYCSSVEHKMGIHASPTCTMLFGREGRCRGFLLGEEGQGIRLMFDMMNAARIEVGLQGTAVGAAAHLAALDYARERVQMRSWSPAQGSEPVAIVEHPDIRRMLLGSAATVQAMRALLLRTSWHLDRAHTSEGDERRAHQAAVALLTPVCKAWASDWGFRVAEWSVQVFGGYGYTRDYPVEQYLRDVKITSIYEGTNGIQALDFVGRKLAMDGGRPLAALLDELDAAAATAAGDAELAGAAREVGAGVATFRRLVAELPRRADGALLLTLNAVPLLDLFGALAGGGFLLQQAAIARTRLAGLLAGKGLAADATAEARRAAVADNAQAVFLHNKIQAAVHFGLRLVPTAAAQAVAIEAGDRAAMEAIL